MSAIQGNTQVFPDYGITIPTKILKDKTLLPFLMEQLKKKGIDGTIVVAANYAAACDDDMRSVKFRVTSDSKISESVIDELRTKIHNLFSKSPSAGAEILALYAENLALRDEVAKLCAL